MNKIKYYIISLIAIGLLLILFMDKLIILDNNILNYINNNLRDPFLIDLMKFFSFLGSGYFFVISSILLLIFYKNKNKYYIIFTLLFIFLTSQGLKLIFQRDRPIDMLVIESTYSFPSGHAMVSAAVYGIIMYLIIISKMTKLKKVIFCIFLSIIIFLISFSRMYLGVHYFSDIYAGILISSIYILLFIYVENKMLKNRKIKK